MKPQENSGSVLILTPEGRDAEVASTLLKHAAVSTAVCLDLDQLIRLLPGADAAVIAEEALLRADRADLAKWIDNQPPWSDFPFVLLSFRGTATDARLTDLLGNVTVIERPFHPSVLVNAVRSASRARRRQREAERHLDERRRAEEHKDLLTRELQHRVKNTFATVEALVRATGRSATSVEEFARNLSERVHSLSRTHGLLLDGGWRNAPLHELLENEIGPFQDESGQRIVLSGPSIELPPTLALSIGMAVHELATNAAKYGCLSVPEGRLNLGWDVRRNGHAPHLILDWTELGGPPVSTPSRKGFGSTLINRVLATQHGAKVSSEFSRSGLMVRVELPLQS